MTRLVAVFIALMGVAGATSASAQSPADRAQCQARWATYRSEVARFNAECGSVVPGSDQARACAARRARLEASRPDC